MRHSYVFSFFFCLTSSRIFSYIRGFKGKAEFVYFIFNLYSFVFLFLNIYLTRETLTVIFVQRMNDSLNFTKNFTSLLEKSQIYILFNPSFLSDDSFFYCFYLFYFILFYFFPPPYSSFLIGQTRTMSRFLKKMRKSL